MGLELRDCLADIKDKQVSGTLYLDSATLQFRSSDFKWSIPIGKGTSAKTEGDCLVVRRGSKKARFEVGKTASKWADKILNPPTRGKKLGLKSGDKFWVSGTFDDTFLNEVKAHELSSTRQAGSCNIAFVRLQSAKDLKKLEKAATSCSEGTHIWAIWPKGIDAIKQSEVIAQARKHGMGPGKGISFDEIHSAMRFTVK